MLYRTLLIIITITIFNGCFSMESSKENVAPSEASSSQGAQPCCSQDVVPQLTDRQLEALMKTPDIIERLKRLGLGAALTTPVQTVKACEKGTQADRLFTRSFPSTEGKTEDKLIGLVRNETKGIDITAYEFNAYRVAYELCKKKSDGIPIRLILNGGCKKTVALLLMERCGIPMKFCTPGLPVVAQSGGIMHQKAFRFDANKGKSVLLNPTDKKDDYILSNDCEDAVPFYWDGSFNVTGRANKQNIESTTVVSDEVTYPTKKKEFESWWNNRLLCKDDLVGEIESSVTTNDLNGVPSQNVFHLLRSKFYIDNQNRHLSSAEILSHQDFAPTSYPGYDRMPKLIPTRRIELPFVCQFYGHYDAAQQLSLEVEDKDNNRTALSNLLEALAQHRINKYAVKLYWIGDHVDARHWFFKDDEGNYLLVSDLNQNRYPVLTHIEGPYVQCGENYELVRHVESCGKTKSLRRHSYTKKELKIAQTTQGSLSDLLKEYISEA